MIGAERPVCRSAFGECYLLTAKQYHTRVPAGGISALVWHYTLYPNAPHPQNKCDSRTLQKLPTAQTNKKLPPRAPAPNKAKQIFTLQRRVLLGEVLGERGRFGGREPPLSRGGALSLQGLPPHPTTGYPAAVCAAMRSSQRETISSVES